jgi:hypothetical protein
MLAISGSASRPVPVDALLDNNTYVAFMLTSSEHAIKMRWWVKWTVPYSSGVMIKNESQLSH